MEMNMLNNIELFEKECRNGLLNGGLSKYADGRYASSLTDAVFRGWVASRRSIEIELPGTHEAETISEMRDCCIQAITDIGISAK